MAIGNTLRSRICLMQLFRALVFMLLNGASPSEQGYRSFRDWCSNQTRLSGTTRNLIETLLLKVETSDCELAQQRLGTLTHLNLDATPLSDPNQVVTGPISDLRPLSTLTQLQSLNLYHQDLTDLRPLSLLVNLTHLNLQGTGVTNIQPFLNSKTYGRLIYGITPSLTFSL